jgi:hypothetical protein
VEALQELARVQAWESFQAFVGSSGQTSGFATPLTFLSFYDPQKFPMLDKRIGQWWPRRFPNEPQFTWNGKVISPSKQSWIAYLAWTEFCRRQATKLSTHSAAPWRARDVEMAV